MVVKTKKYQLESKKYISLAMGTVIKKYWWALLIPIALAACTFLVPSTNWFWISALIITALYFLFWYIQFAGLTQMEQAKMLFEKLAYEIDSRQILIKLNAKQGMPIKWDQVQKAYVKKDAFLFVINKVQLVHLPHRIFNNPSEIKFVESVLKRKKLI
ncbi:MAG: YcxB family protein [Cyclobacteriaceae bacterium]